MRKTVFVFALLATACGQNSDPTATSDTRAQSEPTSDTASIAQIDTIGTSAPLSERLNCLRENQAALVIAHRGGPNRDFPENALETFSRSRNAGARGMEIDIAESSDGVLFLMHDDDLERTTTGDGYNNETSWTEIEKLALETYSKTTDFHVPTLNAALAWAVQTNTLIELDKKRSTAFGTIIDAVEAAHAQNNVLIITYTDDQAADVHKRAPDLMITASVNSIDHLDRLIRDGVNPDHLIAWTGTEQPNPSLWKQLNARGIEVAFGTLGRRGERLDDIYWEDDDGSEYQTLATDGATLIVTDLSDKVSRELNDWQTKARACGF